MGVDKNTSINHTLKMGLIKQILDSINQDFKLHTILEIETFDLGRSSANEELAIKLSQEYFKYFGENTIPSSIHPDTLSHFLTNSFLATDLNEVLKPYNLKINNIQPEKAFLLSASKLPYTSISQNTNQKILDTWLWISIGMIKE